MAVLLGEIPFAGVFCWPQTRVAELGILLFLVDCIALES